MRVLNINCIYIYICIYSPGKLDLVWVRYIYIYIYNLYVYGYNSL